MQLLQFSVIKASVCVCVCVCVCVGGGGGGGQLTTQTISYNSNLFIVALLLIQYSSLFSRTKFFAFRAR